MYWTQAGGAWTGEYGEPATLTGTPGIAWARGACEDASWGWRSPQGVGGDGHDALGALLRGEARGVLQRLVGKGRQVEAGLVRVAQPGPAGHGQDLRTDGRSTFSRVKDSR